MDITELILFQHHEQRRMFALLDDIDRNDSESLDIRDAVAEVSRHEAGGQAWWSAVIDARIANSDHMAEEEREDLAGFRRHADLQTRHDIAVEFVTYQAQHPVGIRARDEDPNDYLDEHT